MKKNKVNVREICQKYQANCARINAIADLCETENREVNDAEKAEIKTLRRENEILRMRAAASADATIDNDGVNADKMLRENLSATKKVTISLQREIQTSAALEDTGIIPVQQQEMIKPLRAGLIYDKVGINIPTGLAGGSLRWPKHTKAVASFADEGERATDSKIDFSKLETKPQRMTIAIPITREELDNSDGIVERVVREEMPQAIIDLVNDALFTTSGTYTDKEGKTKTRKVYGPFVEAAKTATQFAGAIPTRKELLKLKSQVTGSGINLVAPCWVMTEAMKAELEDLKADAGSGRFVCENDVIFGYPVFTTAAIGEGNVGFGDWSCQAAGFFGQMDIVVDPYTLARNNATDFVLHGHFATETLYPEAFALGKVKTA